ncbi:hypothetical protein OJ997_14385 [Solirubrobacter phytolaccae]|uniref:Uncharacterized protein n=1 Tax=Solirubrobacter phytolaccae TaxID=1404360 RepID=A0A9X3S7W2_9ACTN|nr:hypothetical protein [Solirubrobacter phytolaccae]MDA0181489.1 hypothetical protein [Solirubrobacter phytolaccae]
MRVPARRESEVAAQRRREPPPPHPLLALQQSAGNQAVVRHLARFAEPELDTEQVMERLAYGRQTLFAAMRSAKDEKERRLRTMALRAFDAPWLARLRAAGTDKQHPDPDVQDMVLAALQLEAISTAEGVLRDPEDAARITKDSVGMRDDHLPPKEKYDWCGFFAVDKFMESDLDRELKAGYFHVANVYAYFTYVYGKRVPQWIYADDAWHETREYHKLRGAERRWLTAEDMECQEELDIRPGDLALVDHSWGGRGDHIVMVHSFNPQTRVLHTIGGNDSGLQVDTRKGEHAPANEKEGRLEDATGTPLRTYRKGDDRVGMREYDLAHQPDVTERTRDYTKIRIAAIGRPSIVDFENHRYSGEEFPPATAPR